MWCYFLSIRGEYKEQIKSQGKRWELHSQNNQKILKTYFIFSLFKSLQQDMINMFITSSAFTVHFHLTHCSSLQNVFRMKFHHFVTSTRRATRASTCRHHKHKKQRKVQKKKRYIDTKTILIEQSKCTLEIRQKKPCN